MILGLAFFAGIFVGATEQPNYYRILDDDLAAMKARIDTILKAQYQIRSSAFIISNDMISLRGLALMRQRASKGVESRIIGDALFTKIPPAMVKYLADLGVHIRHHHPVMVPRRMSTLWRHPYWLLQRMHDKSLAADETQGIFGGRNSEVTYFGEGTKNYRDRDVLVGGPVLKDFNDYYDQLWASDHVVVPNMSRVLSYQMDDAKRQLDQAWEELQRTGLLEQDLSPLTDADLHPAPLKILTDRVAGDERDVSKVREALIDLVKSAKSEFLFENPYLIPSQRGLDLLDLARKHNVRVRGLTSSAASNDGVLPSGGYLYRRPQIAERGVEIHEYLGPKALHAKSAVIDREIAIIASFNLDDLSAHWNLELAVVSWDPIRAKQLADSIENDMKSARLVTTGQTSVNRGLVIGLKDFEGVPPLKVFQVRCAQVLSRLTLFRRHL